MKKNLILITVMLIFISAYITTINNYMEAVQNTNMTRKNDQQNMNGVQISTFDSEGREINIAFPKIPERVVVDRMDNLETMLAFGLEKRIVLVSVRKGNISYDNLEKQYGERLKKIPGLDRMDFDLESVVDAEPDFILGWKSTFTPRRIQTTSWWNKRGVKSYIVSTSNHVLPTGTIEDECKYLSDIGKIFRVTDKSDQMIQEIHETLSDVKAKVSGRKSQSVMAIELSGRAITNYDDGWILGDMVKQMGGYMPVHSKVLGVEDLISYNPEVLFVIYLQESQRENIEKFLESPKVSSLKAIRDKRVYLIQLDYIYAPGVKTIQEIRMVRDGLYPDLADT